ncbi:hypothetical protein B0H14DRAFT_3516381 [Mycena olivaceomarginata]|nr:hypothetical protein B0H14DRAFT_3516381 [Mycena olivaceomarginata]
MQKYEDESRNHLTQKLEDMTFLQADEYTTVAEMWLDLSTITSSAKAALIATNIAHTVTAAAQASGTTPAPGLTIASGNSASTQAIPLAPTCLMHLAVEEWDRIEAEKKRNTPLKSRKDTGVALSAQSSASSSSSQSHGSTSAAIGTSDSSYTPSPAHPVQLPDHSWPKLNTISMGTGNLHGTGSFNAAASSSSLPPAASRPSHPPSSPDGAPTPPDPPTNPPDRDPHTVSMLLNHSELG